MINRSLFVCQKGIKGGNILSKEQNKDLFYTKTAEEVLKNLDSSIEGLSTAQAQERLATYGRNELEEGEKRSLLAKFLDQFKDLMILILLIAAILSVVTSGGEDIADAIIILAVVIINAIFGVYQEGKAEEAIEALKSMSSPAARALRDGHVTEVDSKELVPGDIVMLEAGDVVPADMRLLEANSLKIEEAALTGESVPVEKHLTVDVAADAGIGDRINMAFQNSNVTYGRGMGVVVNTGMFTEVGHIAGMLQNADETDTPLKQNLNGLSKVLTYAILIIAAITFVVGVFVQGKDPLGELMTSVALAVAAIPEGLPAIVTIVLALGTQVLAKRNSIVRKLPAVETLGSTEIIASDKTGTLTMNKMTVEKVFYDGSLHEAKQDIDLGLDLPLLRSVVLANDTKIDQDGKLIGDPTETALIRFSQKNGMQAEDLRSQYPRLAEIPFDSDRKLMSTLNQTPQGKILFTKGAADVLTERMLITTEEKEKIHKQVEALSKQGLRLLCFAGKPFDGDTISLEDETDLQYMGLIAMMDPPRPESAEAVAACKAAGIKPVMITGDHVVTAAAIAKEISILEQETEAVEGSALDAYTDEQLVDFVKDKSVYARVTPEHKIRIVRAWQARNCMVAMTGDGVNDAPALKQADVGVAMGITGTEVSKDAAAMVLTDDNFATIVKAIENGRNLYENIKRAILFLLSGNLAGILVVLACALAGLGQPFAAIHLLFINLLTDSLPAIGLGLEPHQASVMRKKPRPANESILTKPFLISTGYSGLIIGIMTFLAYVFGRSEGGNYLGMTMAFATLCMSRLWHGFSCKSEEPVLFRKQMINNPFGLMAFFAGMILINAVLLVPPLKSLFSIASLTGLQYAWIHIFSFGSMILIQIVKFVKSVVQRSAS